jgi:acetylornithine/N-succinyldiaminopimelate aminotransferase
MPGKKKDKFENLAKTSENPMSFEVERAEGICFYDKQGRKYIDLIAGICVNNLGHRHPSVIKAIKEQCDKYLHVMAYGEFIEEPQIRYASLLTTLLPESLDSVYFVNSGAEAIEGALKVAKRYNSRTEIISFTDSYYGGTHGALSIAGNNNFKNAFRPLLPDIRTIRYNDLKDLYFITEKTSCVVAECIQGESGYIVSDVDYLQVLRKRCDDTGTLLILDEVQTGFGRTGELFAFEHYGIVPDILVLAKALGGGMPLGAFIASTEIMGTLKSEPMLGHITTFGGHPVSCSAGMASLRVLLDSRIYKEAEHKGKLFKQYLKHEKISEIRGKGLLLALRFENEDTCQEVINNCFKKGLITDSFVFAGDCMRISPPLIITEEEIKKAAEIIISAINQIN